MKDYKEISNKLYNILKESGWGNLMKGFFNSDDFIKIIKYLDEEVSNNHRFTPTLKNIFKPFQECNYNNLKVIIINEEPYDQLNIADGLAFSTQSNSMTPSELYYILNDINKTVYNNSQVLSNLNRDLTRWANQGVLLLNSSLTTVINKPGLHYNIWESFITYLIDMIKNQEIIWVFIGKTSYLEELIPEKSIKFVCECPSSMEWKSYNLFNRINENLNEKIVW